MTGFCVCIWYIVTLNEQADCSIARKVAYSFFYLGFCFYDVYQLYKIKAIVEPGIAVSSVMYGLLAVRFASYVYNITAVTGVVAQISASRISKFGPCTSSFTSISIYQEHIVSLLFESLLAVIFVVYVNSNRSKSMPLSEFVRKIVDFEILSFIIYFVVECLYTVVYTVIDKSMISLLNTFYLNVPIMLFFMNICMFFRKRTQRLKDTSVETAVSSRP